MKSFASDSTIHGINFICGENQRKFSRIFWIFLVFFSFCGFAFYINYAYTKWQFSPDIAMRSQERNAVDFPLAAITFCPRMFSKIGLVDYMKSISSELISNRTECEYLAANLVWCAPYFIDQMKSNCRAFFKEIDQMNIIEMINKSAYSIDEVFGEPAVLDPMRILTHQGICFTTNLQDLKGIFNEEIIHSDFDCYRQRKYPNIEWTVERGYFNENASYPWYIYSGNAHRYIFNYGPAHAENTCGSTAFTVIVHLPNEMPTKFHKFMPISYGSRSAIFIKAKSHRTDNALRNYSPDVRKCFFEGERQLKFFKSYSKAHCDLECLTNDTLKSCGCVLFNMPRNKTTRVCRFSEMGCMGKGYSDKRRNALCDCHPPCNTLLYEVDYSPSNVIWKIPDE